eukprot:10455572-Ditylum_brightwellii.AAC.1
MENRTWNTGFAVLATGPNAIVVARNVNLSCSAIRGALDGSGFYNELVYDGIIIHAENFCPKFYLVKLLRLLFRSTVEDIRINTGGATSDVLQQILSRQKDRHGISSKMLR